MSAPPHPAVIILVGPNETIDIIPKLINGKLFIEEPMACAQSEIIGIFNFNNEI